MNLRFNNTQPARDSDMNIYANPPSKCAICLLPIKVEFYDFRLPNGQWANGCPDCFESFSGQLGIGKGQRFHKKSDGDFHQVKS